MDVYTAEYVLALMKDVSPAATNIGNGLFARKQPITKRGMGRGLTLRSYVHPYGTSDNGVVLLQFQLDMKDANSRLVAVPIRSAQDLVFYSEAPDPMVWMVAEGQVWYSCKYRRHGAPYSPLVVMSVGEGVVECVRRGRAVTYLLDSFWPDMLQHAEGFSRVDFFAAARKDPLSVPHRPSIEDQLALV